MPKAPPPARRVRISEIRPGQLKDRYPVPKEFRPRVDLPAGRYPILEVFEGLELTVPFRKYPGDDFAILDAAKATSAQITPGPGYMYVAPPRTPPEIRASGFRMFETKEDVIVVGQSHLQNSPRMDVYLDIIHEFLHILQRRQGRVIWPRANLAYVDRPTEIEAYSFSVAEARRLGVPDSYLRAYLRVPWTSDAENRRLLRNVGVTLSTRRR
ncbi:MAG: hypothetical protein WBE40_01315 [Thermoplasmata archaeon]